MTKLYTRTHLETSIQSAIDSDSSIARHALMVLFSRQVADEPNQKRNIVPNRIGFTRNDAKSLTLAAMHYRSNGYLSEDVLNDVTMKVRRYKRQLADAWTSGEFQMEMPEQVRTPRAPRKAKKTELELHIEAGFCKHPTKAGGLCKSKVYKAGMCRSHFGMVAKNASTATPKAFV